MHFLISTILRNNLKQFILFSQKRTTFTYAANTSQSIEDIFSNSAAAQSEPKFQIDVYESHIKHELDNVRNAKKNIEIALEELRCIMSQVSLEKSVAMLQYSKMCSGLHLVDQENDVMTIILQLKDLERKLIVELKSLNLREEHYFQLFLLAINDSNEKQNSNTSFLKRSILLCRILILLLAAAVVYTHNLSFINDRKFAADKMKEETPNHQTWGSYLMDYVRPLYSWILPKK